jgi:hypothetical protein
MRCCGTKGGAHHPPFRSCGPIVSRSSRPKSNGPTVVETHPCIECDPVIDPATGFVRVSVIAPIVAPVIDPVIGVVIAPVMAPLIDPVIEFDPVIDTAELLDSGIAAKLPKRPCASFFTPAVK